MVESRGRYIIDFSDIPSQRHHMPELEVEQRIANFDEVELGLPEEDARNEARRCLSCRRCLGCELCWAACTPRAIVFQKEPEVLEFTADEVIIPEDVGREMLLKKGEYGYRQYRNVVDAFQFEAILSEDGPYGGMILRPYDGDIPARIAFVLDAKNDSLTPLFSYLMEEAAQARKKVSDLAISIFVKEPVAEAAADGITLKAASIEAVKEHEDTRNLLVTVNENGATSEEEFDLLVIAKPPVISKEIKNLQKKIG